ncbi:hypothetical protein ACQ4PT_069355 [Festuca glaucescens]
MTTRVNGISNSGVHSGLPLLPDVGLSRGDQISNGGCAVLLTAHIALGQLVFCFCFYIGSYTNVVQRIGKAASDERLLCLAKRAVLRSGYLIMESLISDVKDDMTMEDFDRFASIIRRVESLHKLGFLKCLQFCIIQ